MTLQTLNCFMVVARTLNIAKAAELLYMSKPAVSRYITALEEEYHTALFKRSSHKLLGLTEAGAILYQALTECDTIYHEAEQKILAAACTQPIIFNIPIGTNIPDSVLNQINEFNQNHPDIYITFRYINYADTNDALQRGEAIFIHRELLPSIHKCELFPLPGTAVPYYLLYSRDHHAIRKDVPPTLDDFKDCPLFLSNEIPQVMIDFYERLYSEFAAKPSDIHITKSIESILLILKTNESVTMCDGWSNLLTHTGYEYLPLRRSTSYSIALDTRKAPELLKKLVKDCSSLTFSLS